VVESDDDLVALSHSGDDELAPLVRVSDKSIVWSANGVVNGNSTYGTLTISDPQDAVFLAPSKVPSGSSNPVSVSAKIDNHFTYHGKKFDNTFLISNVTIVDKEVYKLEMKILDSPIQMDPDYMVVTDSVSMIVTIEDTTVTISEITNFPSTANPTQLVYTHEAYYFVPDPIGEINITSASGKIGPYAYSNSPDGRLLALLFIQTGTHDPKWRYTADGGYQDYGGGGSNPGFPSGWSFELAPDGTVVANSAPLVGILDKVMEVTLTQQK
jgi:hypothetical protein